MLKKFLSDKINVTKNALFFLSQAPTHHSFTYNSQFLYELKHSLISLKLCAGFPIFNFVSFLFKFIFLFNKKHNRKAIHSFTPRPLIFKLQQEVCYPGDELFKLRKSKF